MSFRPYGVSASVVFTDGDAAFSCELRSAVLNPSPDWINTLCAPGSWPDVGWSLDLGYLPGTKVDDIDPDTGDTEPGGQALNAFLWDHYGEQQGFIFWPYGDSQDAWAGTCSIAPGPVGGSQGEIPELSVSLPVTCQPDLLPVDNPDSVSIAEALLEADGLRRQRSRARSQRRSLVAAAPPRAWRTPARAPIARTGPRRW